MAVERGWNPSHLVDEEWIMYASTNGHRAPGRPRHRRVESDPEREYYVTRPYTLRRPAPARLPGESSRRTVPGKSRHQPRSPSRSRSPSVERAGSPYAGSRRFAQNHISAMPRSPSPGHERSASGQGSLGDSAPLTKDYDVLQPPQPALFAPSAAPAPHPAGMGQEVEQGPDAPARPPSPTPTQLWSVVMPREGSHHTVHHPPPASAHESSPSRTPHERRHASNHEHERDHHRDHQHRHHDSSHHRDTPRHRSRPRPPSSPSHRYTPRYAQPVYGHGPSAVSVQNASRVSLSDGVPLHRNRRATTTPPPAHGTSASYYYHGAEHARTPSGSSHQSHAHAHSRAPSPKVPPSTAKHVPPHKLEKPPPSPPPAANEIHHFDPPPRPLAASELCRNPHRPALPDNYDGQVQTRYVNMLLAMDGISPVYYVLSSFFTWILLAGFVLLPGTFASWRDRPAGTTQSLILNLVNHIDLYAVAFACTGIGAAGMLFMWWRWHGNYIWVSNRIFIPGFLNSVAGMISSLTSIYTTQAGVFGKTEKSALIVTGSLSLVCGILTLVYDLWLIRNLKLEHDHEVGVELAGKYGAGVVGDKREGEDIEV